MSQMIQAQAMSQVGYGLALLSDLGWGWGQGSDDSIKPYPRQDVPVA